MEIKEVKNFNKFLFQPEIPDLLEFQKESFFRFINEKIPKLLEEISPVETPKAELEFFDPKLFHQSFQLRSVKRENSHTQGISRQR